ncbi:MAG: TonB family protein [Mariprofundaceae bacterium]|nr:TonB family protein [Mariprofundaceae bacterium]
MNRLSGSYTCILTLDAWRRRDKQRQAWLGLASLLLALTIHLGLLLHFTDALPQEIQANPYPPLLEVQLVTSAHASEPKPQKKESDRQIKENPAPPTPEIIKPDPIVRRVVKKKTPPIIKPAAPLRKPVHASQPAPAPIKMAAQAEHQAQTLSGKQHVLRLREQYLARIMAMIEAQKTYPRSARRRHIEGDIELSFSVDADGRISDIRTDGTHSILCAACRDTLLAAGRMPPPVGIPSPARFKLTMQYRLK